MSGAQNQRPGGWAADVFAAAEMSLLLHPLVEFRAVVVLPVSTVPVLVVSSLSERREPVVLRLSKSGPC